MTKLCYTVYRFSLLDSFNFLDVFENFLKVVLGVGETKALCKSETEDAVSAAAFHPWQSPPAPPSAS